MYSRLAWERTQKGRNERQKASLLAGVGSDGRGLGTDTRGRTKVARVLRLPLREEGGGLRQGTEMGSKSWSSREDAGSQLLPGQSWGAGKGGSTSRMSVKSSLSFWREVLARGDSSGERVPTLYMRT